MSISAVTGISQAHPTTDQTEATMPAPSVTPFSQQLDGQDAQTEAAHGHHHHGGASQSVMSSAATAASAAGVAPSGSVAASVLNLLS
jgi:hypothetical protein